MNTGAGKGDYCVEIDEEAIAPPAPALSRTGKLLPFLIDISTCQNILSHLLSD